MGRVGLVGWVGQFTKWHSKTRLTGTQALDKVWSHLKKHVQVLAQSPPRGIPGSAESWGVIRHGLFQHQFTSDSGGSF